MSSIPKNQVATGTTTLRTLESIYWMAVLHKRNGEFPDILPQWAYGIENEAVEQFSYEDALAYLLKSCLWVRFGLFKHK